MLETKVFIVFDAVGIYHLWNWLTIVSFIFSWSPSGKKIVYIFIKLNYLEKYISKYIYISWNRVNEISLLPRETDSHQILVTLFKLRSINANQTLFKLRSIYAPLLRWVVEIHPYHSSTFCIEQCHKRSIFCPLSLL